MRTLFLVVALAFPIYTPAPVPATRMRAQERLVDCGLSCWIISNPNSGREGVVCTPSLAVGLPQDRPVYMFVSKLPRSLCR